MISRITLLFFILLAAKIIELEDVAETSELLAIILVIGFIAVPIYLIFKILQEMQIIKKEILGPSWGPKKNNALKTIVAEKDVAKETSINGTPASQENYEKEKEQSVKAIALIRAYRIRGHLIANLDPLRMMEREYLHELHPADHGFKKEDYNKKIYLYEYMDRGYATINELLSFLKKTYCSTIGVEYMHISDPIEKIWFSSNTWH